MRAECYILLYILHQGPCLAFYLVLTICTMISKHSAYAMMLRTMFKHGLLCALADI